MHVTQEVIEIKLKKLDDKESIYASYPLIKQLTPDMSEEKFRDIQDAMLEEGYQCVGAFDNEGTLRGICGYWVSHRFYCGKTVRIDNIIVSNQMRGKGIGKALMAWVDKEAQRLWCDSVILDAYVENKKSHDFYLKNEMSIIGLHFIKSYTPANCIAGNSVELKLG